MNRENPLIPEALDALGDDELNAVIKRAEELLKEHDRQRKEKAMAEIAAILAASGLTPDDLAQKLRAHRAAAGARKPVYRGGVRYQHPVDKSLIWTAKGQKPNWLRKLETEGGRALELPAEPANDNAAIRKAANDDAPVPAGDKPKAPIPAGSVNGG